MTLSCPFLLWNGSLRHGGGEALASARVFLMVLELSLPGEEAHAQPCLVGWWPLWLSVGILSGVGQSSPEKSVSHM